ncbi:major facilitator transporter [Oscillochloris trichoides DG-6]|uniref:Major facilitator transporter n=1 Tax=Oscillochloris trichoides DG-6 TaxID=765420 RepID=E1II87_9CHLR|nr:MFS transporter [Oscillochloris trichoides]EFO79115.1 major facilitator transporter [Oscillochloris trichoides DG-6]
MSTTKTGSSLRMVLTVLFLGVLMGALDIAIVGPALPALREWFRIDDRAGAWIFTIYVFFNLLGAPLMAKLSDRYGRRPAYMLAVGLFALGSALAAMAPSFLVLLLGRSLQGLGAGGIFPVASAVVGDSFPADRKGFALGMIGAVFGLAFLFGPIVGALLLSISWQWIFLINLPLAALVLILGWMTLPTTGATQPQPFDTLGLITLTLLLGGLTVGASNIDANNLVGSLMSPLVWPFFVVAVLSIPAFWWAEGQAADPLIRRSLISTPQLALANTITAGAGLGEGVIVFLPSLAVAAYGVSESTASYMTLPVVLAMAVGSPVAGRLLDKIGSRIVVIGGALLLSFGMLLLGLFGGQLWAFYVASCLIGAGLASLIGAPIRYIMLNEAPPEDRTAAQSAVTVFTGVGQLFSGALVGAVAASAGGGLTGYTTAYVVSAVPAFVLVGLAFGLRRRVSKEKTVVQPSQG